jgi:hypothetical protein
MPAAQRFQLQINGEVYVGLAFKSEADLDAFLFERCPVAEPTIPALAAQTEAAEPCRLGRPSHAALIAAAVRGLGTRLDWRQSRAARARLVAKYIAGMRIENSGIPALRTIEDHLVTHENAHEKSHGNSDPGKS